MKIFAEALLPSSGPLLKVQAVVVQVAEAGFVVCLFATLASDPSILVVPPIQIPCSVAEAADIKLVVLALLDKLASRSGGLAWVNNHMAATSKLINGIVTAKPAQVADNMKRMDMFNFLVTSWRLLATGSERIPYS